MPNILSYQRFPCGPFVLEPLTQAVACWSGRSLSLTCGPSSDLPLERLE